MKKRELKPKKTSTTFVPWKITEVYHTEVEYFNEAELKRMAENLCKLMDNYLKNKEREEIHICLRFMEDLICVKD